MSITRRGAVAGLAALPAFNAWAQPAFPSKPLTLVVPFPAGGPADIFGRNLAQAMSPHLGQPVLVENKSGAAGVTGVDFVAKAGSDAHVMGLMSASAGAIMQSLMPKMPYDPAKDLAPIVLVVRVQEVLAVNAKTGITDLKGLIAYAKANPGKLTCASAGTGGITHLALELFKRETGTDILHVPYRGAAPAVNDLLAGTVQMTILDVPAVLSHIRSGALTALAITSDTSAPLLPGVPSMKELGFPKVNSDNWYALVSPGAASPDHRKRIYDAASAALKSKEVIEAYAKVGGIAGGGTSAELATFLQAEAVKWAAVIKAANVKLE
ncbi:MAG: tripartite tricarboxylate transporter substrate-binding protein [Reyranella sp.]|uniref:Bug family tripartite tricarboxylate transporter substrate binding protein n=1 Tax=Reyranella sp. TaxID=1929291 RepID=UPI002730C331|nr:tripartite tricarboxylate transporter substrate-binding protein [Reyranella sp.]MDP1961588.1 tripartite tricarboxylate transporter substrate-binding protein [Reyranella sp.]MDP2378252.1 tripartite tricarboxylate transporter substrate-binding protein [Reyranella sp.]